MSSPASSIVRRGLTGGIIYLLEGYFGSRELSLSLGEILFR